MLRATLLYLSDTSWAHRLVTSWRFACRAASRFIAGDTLDEAIEKIRTLNAQGIYVTMDHLGENVTSPQESIGATDDYLQSLKRIQEDDYESNISVKLSQLGLKIEFNTCLGNMRRIAKQAAEYGIMVRIDIEDSQVVDATWKIFRDLRAEGFTNIGLAIQSYLYRSEADAKALAGEGAHFRLCKGAYKEPPDIAYPRKADVDANFDRITKILIDTALSDDAEPLASTGKIPSAVAIASHDIRRIEFARDYAREAGLPSKSLEFQMLLGIRSDLQRMLFDEGYPVRIYVPYGTQWYPFFMRRLAERPANLWFFLSNLVRRQRNDS